MASSFSLLNRSAGVQYGECGGVWVMMLFAPPSADDMRAARPTLRAMSDRFPDGYPTLTWVLPGAGFSMDAEARKLAATITDEFSSAILAQATLVEGSGFQAAAVRAIISGIDMMARSKAPKKVFGELRPSLEWCLPFCPAASPRAPVAEVLSALAATRTTFG